MVKIFGIEIEAKAIQDFAMKGVMTMESFDANSIPHYNVCKRILQEANVYTGAQGSGGNLMVAVASVLYGEVGKEQTEKLVGKVITKEFIGSIAQDFEKVREKARKDKLAQVKAKFPDIYAKYEKQELTERDLMTVAKAMGL